MNEYENPLTDSESLGILAALGGVSTLIALLVMGVIFAGLWKIFTKAGKYCSKNALYSGVFGFLFSVCI